MRMTRKVLCPRSTTASSYMTMPFSLMTEETPIHDYYIVLYDCNNSTYD
jgi:hypothetical protein